MALNMTQMKEVVDFAFTVVTGNYCILETRAD